MTLQRLQMSYNGLVPSELSTGGYYRADKVDAEIAKLRQLLAEVVECDETNGWTPFVLDQNNLLDTTRRNVTVPTKLIERAKELLHADN